MKSILKGMIYFDNIWAWVLFQFCFSHGMKMNVKIQRNKIVEVENS